MDTTLYPLSAITQRSTAMYHSWDSQNAWLRQIQSHNDLHVNPVTAAAAGVADGGWAWVESAWGRVRCLVRTSDAVEPGTVWTWNAIGKGAGARQLALVIDLNVCVGCHACVTSCKEWNTSGAAGPLSDLDAYGEKPSGTFFNRVQTYEADSYPNTQTIHFPKSCLHCEEPPCVPVCPTGASYKRKSDGIVLVDYDKCIGCKYCSWACPYGAREFDEERKVMTKCTLCVDRIYDELLPPADRKPACVKACPTGARLFGDVKDPDSEVSRAIRERGGYPLMPEWETRPANQYLPRRVTPAPGSASGQAVAPDGEGE